MVKLIKSVIHKQAENKEADWSAQLQPTAFGGTNFNTQNIVPVSPYSSYLQIGQGTSTTQRVGNKITTRKLMLRFVATPAAYDATNNNTYMPQDVTIYFVKSRDTPVSLTSSSGLGGFFQSSSGSSAPTGNLYDQVKRVNNDAWIVCKKINFKLGWSIQNGQNGANTNASNYFANNDYKYNVIRTINLTKWCPKTVLYNDNNTTPQSPTLQMIILPSNADGTNYANSAQRQINMFYQLYYEYEDI